MALPRASKWRCQHRQARKKQRQASRRRRRSRQTQTRSACCSVCKLLASGELLAGLDLGATNALNEIVGLDDGTTLPCVLGVALCALYDLHLCCSNIALNVLIVNRSKSQHAAQRHGAISPNQRRVAQLVSALFLPVRFLPSRCLLRQEGSESLHHLIESSLASGARGHGVEPGSYIDGAVLRHNVVDKLLL